MSGSSRRSAGKEDVAPSRRQIRKSLTTNFSPGLAYYRQRLTMRAAQALHYPSYLLGGKLDRPVFVLGAPRSGTTLLYRVLRRSPYLAHWQPSEAHEVWELDHHPTLRNWESNVLGAADADDATARRIRRSFYLVAGNHKRFIDKTPRNTLRVPFVDAIFPDAIYVFLQRDGRENVNSLINAWRSPRYRVYELPEPHRIPGVDPNWWKFVLYPGWQADIAGPLEVVCARQWKFANDYSLDARASIEGGGVSDRAQGRWVTVRYEDLIDDPSSEVGRIMELLGVPLDDVVRAAARAVSDTPVNVVTPPERGKWKKENPAEIERIVPLIAATMGRLGYPS